MGRAFWRGLKNERSKPLAEGAPGGWGEESGGKTGGNGGWLDE